MLLVNVNKLFPFFPAFLNILEKVEQLMNIPKSTGSPFDHFHLEINYNIGIPKHVFRTPSPHVIVPRKYPYIYIP